MYGYFGFGRGVNQTKQIETILDNDELNDEEKLEKILNVEFLKQQVGSTINHKLVEFLQKREIIEKLIKLSVSNPADPNNVEESFKYPNVA